ncbi:hypothetical protein BGZ95_004500 [Linnemannia exigua]|uniref:Uncharacterized protein n=1 Tax=Linnemannia exigua TaxID=604196 RepID=A0AAD4H9B6_9FUNG|nr:hypothetical protein BGZ95_004500 [Linnemannia exigua]
MVPAGLACFDFDWSLIDTDSDRFVIEYLSPVLRHKLDTSPMQWTDLQNECLKEYHDQGGSGQKIRESLTKIPLDSKMIQACQLLHSKGWVLAIISDANQVYIEGILEHYGIKNLFSAIITNPAFWDVQDRLHIQRLIPADGTPHGCPTGVCSLNICKGQEVDKLLLNLNSGTTGSTVIASLDKAAAPLRMLYVGDGRNDYCPALRMNSSEDIYFVRKGRSLEKYLNKAESPEIQKAILSRIVYWDRAGEILSELQSTL